MIPFPLSLPWIARRTRAASAPADPGAAADQVRDVHDRLAREAAADRRRVFGDWRERCPRVRPGDRLVIGRWRARADGAGPFAPAQKRVDGAGSIGQPAGWQETHDQGPLR